MVLLRRNPKTGGVQYHVLLQNSPENAADKSQLETSDFCVPCCFCVPVPIRRQVTIA